VIKFLQVRWQAAFEWLLKRKVSECGGLRAADQATAGELFKRTAGITAGGVARQLRLVALWLLSAAAAVPLILETNGWTTANWVRIGVGVGLVFLVAVTEWYTSLNRWWDCTQALVAVIVVLDCGKDRYVDPSFRGRVNRGLEKLARRIERLPNQLSPGDPGSRSVLYEKSRGCAAAVRKLKIEVAMPAADGYQTVLDKLIADLRTLVSGRWWELEAEEERAKFEPSRRVRQLVALTISAVLVGLASVVPLVSSNKSYTTLAYFGALLGISLFGKPGSVAVTSLSQLAGSIKTIQGDVP
jgi:hypothetical protein